jgi:hypothetical protein
MISFKSSLQTYAGQRVASNEMNDTDSFCQDGSIFIVGSMRSQGAIAMPNPPVQVTKKPMGKTLSMPATIEDLNALVKETAAQYATGAIAQTATLAGIICAVTTVSHAKPAASTPPCAQSDKAPIFDQLGHIVRQLHDALRELGYDRNLSDIATEVTDATDRLEYIATLTAQAANKVLHSTDEPMPMQDRLIAPAKNVASAVAGPIRCNISYWKLKSYFIGLVTSVQQLTHTHRSLMHSPLF